MQSDSESPQTLLIGLVGLPLSGKDTAALCLVRNHGFAHASTSDALRRYIRDNNLGDISRHNMQVVAAQLRAEKGDDILIQIALDGLQGKIALSGMRTVGEVEGLKKRGGKLVCITAPIEMRYERAQARKRDGDGTDFAAFKALEEADFANADPHGQNVGAVMQLADFSISNTGSHEELCAQIDSVLTTVQS